MTYLNKKKIRKEARRHKLSITDLENAVESIDRKNAGQHLESQIYRDAVKNSTRCLWETAEYIVKFVKEVNAQ